MWCGTILLNQAKLHIYKSKREKKFKTYINILSEVIWWTQQLRRPWVGSRWWRPRQGREIKRWVVIDEFGVLDPMRKLQKFCFGSWALFTGLGQQTQRRIHGLDQVRFLGIVSHLMIRFLRYITNNKEADNDWFRLESNKEGTRWFGKCWHYHNQLKYEFDVEFDIPVTYPMTSPEIALPELDGKTAKVKKYNFPAPRRLVT